jgi:hypothetical protein
MSVIRFDSTMRCSYLAMGLAGFFAIAVPMVSAASPPEAPVRVALVTGSGRDSLESLADLVAADLHPDQGLQLLERHDIQPVLAEQNLKNAGLTDPARAVAVGRLLSVDVFAVLDIQPGGIGLVVYDGRSGVRLADQLLDGTTAQQRAVAATAEFRSSLLKQRSRTHPLCLLTVRNADLGSSMDSFCDGIGQILERRLLASNDVTILERRYLDQVNKERELPTSRPSMPLIQSLQFLELEISRGKPPQVYSAMVFLSDSRGNQLATVKASADDAGALVQELLDRVVQKLGAGSPQPPDAVRESARFGLESDFFRSHGQYNSALSASEAAFALNSRDRINKQRLAKDLTTIASRNSPLEAAIPQMERALDLAHDYQRTLTTNVSLLDGSYVEAESRIGDFVAAHVASGQALPLAGSLESLRTEYRSYLIDGVAHWAASPGAKQHSAEWADSAEYAVNALWGRVLPQLNQSSRNRAEFAEAATEVVGNQWLGVYETQTAQSKPHYLGSSDLAPFIKSIFGGYERWHANGFYNHGATKDWAIPDSDLRDYATAIVPLYQKFAASHDPTFQFCGKAGLAWCAAVSGGGFPNDLQPSFQPVAKFAEQLIQGSLDGAARDRMYCVWERAIDLFFRPNEHIIEDGSATSRQRDAELEVMWNFRKSRREYQTAAPNTKLAQTPWARADLICQVHKTPGLEDIDALIHPLVRDGNVWAIGLGRDRGRKFMQLLCLPLVEGPATRLAKLDLEWPEEGYVPPNCSSNSGAAISEDCYYLSSRGIGIMAFPLDGRAGFFINAKNGLPTEHVDSLAYLDGKLYAGLGDGGYIIRYDLKASRCDVIASSRRKGKQSPLDDDLVWEAPCMIADASRHRIVLLAGGLGKCGIWQVNSAGVVSQLYQTSQIAFGDWFSELDGNHVIMSTNSWILDMDLRKDQPTVLHKNPFVAIGPAITPASASITPNVALFPPYMVHDGWLWSGQDFAATNINTGEAHDLPEVTSPPGHEGMVPCKVLQSVNDGKLVLMGDQKTLWLLTFKADRPAATQP